MGKHTKTQIKDIIVQIDELINQISEKYIKCKKCSTKYQIKNSTLHEVYYQIYNDLQIPTGDYNLNYSYIKCGCGEKTKLDDIYNNNYVKFKDYQRRY